MADWVTEPLQCPIEQTAAMQVDIKQQDIAILGIVSLVCVRREKATPTYYLSEETQDPHCTPYFFIEMSGYSSQYFITQDGDTFWSVERPTRSERPKNLEYRVIVSSKDRSRARISSCDAESIRNALEEYRRKL